MGVVAVCLTGCAASSIDDGLSSPVATGSVAQPSALSKADDEAGKKALKKIAAKTSGATKAGAKGYKIGRQDVLQISVFKVPELSKTVEVSEAGTINYPLVGERPAAGKTARQLENDLKSALGKKYLQNPQVTVFISQYNSKRVTIEGAVKKPGLYPLKGGLTLMQLVVSAGGLQNTAQDQVVILRTQGGKRRAARFSFDSIRDGSGNDPELLDGDVVIASTSTSKVAFNNVLKALPLASFVMGF